MRNGIRYTEPTVPVVHPLALDARTLVGRLEGRPGLAWLDADGSTARAMRSYVGSDPVDVLEVPWGEPEPLRALGALDRAPAEAPSSHATTPRFVGFVAYDAVWSGRPGMRHARAPGPVVWFGRYDAMAAFDHATGEAWIVADDADALARFLARIAPDGASPGAGASEHSRPTHGPLEGEPSAPHEAAIHAALEAIAAGSLYQVNLARRFEARFEGRALPLYDAMREASPVPFGLFLQTDSRTPRTILGRSMERFLGWTRRDGRLETRPIKGTIDSGPGEGARAEASARLVADEKEHAEHTMVVDLMRNDLGRVAASGTVVVEEAFVVEPFARLSHLVSTIACTTRPGLGIADVLEATFPPGSVTGTPKSRAVRLIEALEREARGVYCGAYGAVARNGDLTLAVAIRTAVLEDGRLAYHAGGGIVSASSPPRETAETELKTRVLRDALVALDERAASDVRDTNDGRPKPW